jgi:hypothetical protein
MKVTPSDIINSLLNTNADRLSKDRSKSIGSENFQEILDSFERMNTGSSSGETSPVYNNLKFNMNAAVVEGLMNESDDIQAQVNELITEMLRRQGYSEEQVKAGDLNTVEVDEAAQEEARKLIGPGGLLSPEKVSDRIVDFAVAVFGGDKSKIDIIRSSIDQGFGEAEKILGELADVSKVTYEMIQQKLDDWMNEGEGEEEVETV